jgi:hypothetical protein
VKSIRELEGKRTYDNQDEDQQVETSVRQRTGWSWVRILRCPWVFAPAGSPELPRPPLAGGEQVVARRSVFRDLQFRNNPGVLT